MCYELCSEISISLKSKTKPAQNRKKQQARPKLEKLEKRVNTNEGTRHLNENNQHPKRVR